MATNRDIALCAPRLQQAWAHLKAAWEQKYPNGPKIILVETYRSPDVQRAYYAQGREKLAIVNSIRMKVGLPAISEVENRRTITNAKPGQSKHQVQPAQAFDIGFVHNGQMDYSEHNYAEAASILAESFEDVSWGGSWKRLQDRPHFEV